MLPIKNCLHFLKGAVPFNQQWNSTFWEISFNKEGKIENAFRFLIALPLKNVKQTHVVLQFFGHQNEFDNSKLYNDGYNCCFLPFLLKFCVLFKVALIQH